MRLLVLTSVACVPQAEPEPLCDLSGPHLAIATTDYEVGALAAYVPDDDCLDPAMATIGGDTVLRHTGGDLWVVQRTGGDALRRYSPGEYRAPVSEWVVERGGNTHDVLVVDDEVVVSLYEHAEAVVLDHSGAERGRIDLGAHADADGLPEADRLQWVDGHAWLGLQRLDRTQDWAAGTGGQLVQLDLDTLTVADQVDVGPNPKLAPHPDDPAQLAVLTGLFFEPDGAIHTVQPELGDEVALLSEADVGYDVTHLVGHGRFAVVLGVDFEVGGPARLDCLDLQTGTLTGGLDDAAWLVDAVADETGTVWVASRTGWGGAGAAALYRVDPESCVVEQVTDGFTLQPFSLAWVP